MPTTRPRHVLTETDELARALDRAAEHWPDDRDNRTRLLLRLVEAGAEAEAARIEARRQDRLRAIEETSGSAVGIYYPGYLQELREDWPE